MDEKDLRLENFCRAGGFDGVLIRRRSNIAWLTDGADTHIDAFNALGIAALLWTPTQKVVFTDNIESPRLRAEEPFDGWEIRDARWWQASQAALLELVGDRWVASDWPDDAIAALRFSLTPREAERVRALGSDATDVVQRILKQDLKPGMTEWRLAGAVSGWLRDRGILAPVVLVASDDRIAKFRHPLPSGKPIERVVMVAVCAQRHGLTVSLTRLVHFGPLPADLRERHNAVCRVDQRLHEASRVGALWCDILAEGINAYRETGFADEWRNHHQGGPMGYECRDFKATPDEQRAVAPNQLIGWNPSITGTKSEDTIFVSAAGREIITPAGDWPMNGARPDILERENL